MTQIIGLTGGIASGKSTVSQMFKEAKIPVIDTDQITHDLYQKESVVYRKLIDAFGSEIIDVDKSINRKQLGALIYQDEEKRNTLNSIVHPHVKKVVLSEIEKYKNLDVPLVVVDVPLLFETDFIQLVDKSVVVYVSYDQQLDRLIDRDEISESFAKQKIKAQMPLDDKCDQADFVIDNSTSILETKKQFKKLLTSLGA
ncbi:MAG: dephospho-CoA kinase [Candidatus Izimaplasma sp.]|nr:dephospho-CoA kinase [Candidatus Izimaplasma bacterium]